MIVRAHKYLIFGAKEDLDLFCQRAQSEGFIEFILGKRSSMALPESIQTILGALEVFKHYPCSEESCELAMNLQEAVEQARRVLKLRADLDALQEEIRILNVEIARISPFGDFSLEDVLYIEANSHYKVQFFCAKSGKADDLLAREELIFITTECDIDYFISIAPEMKNYPALIEMRMDRSLAELYHQLTYVSESIHMVEQEMKKCLRCQTQFQQILLQELNLYHLAQVKGETKMPLSGTSLFAIEAWIPKTQIKRMITLLEGLSVHCEQIQIEEQDREPTVMENKAASRLGEDLVRFYDPPSVLDKDPSSWVFWSFAVFFAFIVADGGYGLVYLALACYLKWKWKTFTGSAKRLFRLFVVLSCFVVGWGVCTGAFFGIDFGVNSIVKKISPFQKLIEMKAQYHLEQKDDVYQEWAPSFQGASVETGKQFIEKVPHAYREFSDNILLEIALVMGIVHVGSALVRFWRRSWAGVAWAGFLVGAYFFFPKTLDATTLVNIFGWVNKETARAIGQQILSVSVASAFILGLIQNRWKGLLEPMNVIQVSGDVLSYLRLYALALASSIMAVTFNDMGSAVQVIAGILIIVGGHITNIALSSMSGVIHGLRLNFIEWYHYAFIGGGRMFNPLRILKSKED